MKKIFFEIIEHVHEEKLLHCLPNVTEVEELVIGWLYFKFNVLSYV